MTRQCGKLIFFPATTTKKKCMNVQKHKVVLHKKKMIWSRKDVPGPPGLNVLGPGTRRDRT